MRKKTRMTLSEKQIGLIKKYHYQLTTQEMADLLRLTTGAVRYWARKLKLTKEQPSPVETNSLKAFSKAELIEMYKSKTQAAIGEFLGVSQPAIAYWVKKFGLPPKKRGA